MAIDLDRIRSRYESFDDYKIEHLALNEAKNLRPEVVEILKSEISKRGMSSVLLEGINIQLRKITQAEVDRWISAIRRLKCPRCGLQHQPLTGGMIRRVTSYILFTSTLNRPVILCENCLNKKRTDAAFSTLLFGWWGFPMGLINTPISLIRSLRDRNRTTQLDQEILTALVVQNRGVIIAANDNPNKLQHLIDSFNRSI
ncbi:MAG: hypothetical protein HWD92_07525 [Flavobacteriia bacterium]|nr:hypothetical protein [Flavobacteriia bacterium]